MAERYEQLIGDDWPKLPKAIQARHLTGTRRGAVGEFRVRHGQNGMARLLAWGLGIMAAGVFASGVRDLYAAYELPRGGWPWENSRAS
jgi:hypothetical protein